MSLGDPSPRGLSKLRSRNKGLVSASATSLSHVSGEGDGNGDGHSDDKSGAVAADTGLLRSSVDAAIDKVKDKTRRHSVDGRRGSDDVSGRRLSTLVSKTKRKIKGDRGCDPARTLSVDSLGLDGNQSDSASPLEGSGRSSLFTDDEAMDPNK